MNNSEKPIPQGDVATKVEGDKPKTHSERPKVFGDRMQAGNRGGAPNTFSSSTKPKNIQKTTGIIKNRGQNR